MTGEKKLEQQIEEMRTRIEQTIHNGNQFLRDIEKFQKEMAKLQDQIDRKYKRPK